MLFAINPQISKPELVFIVFGRINFVPKLNTSGESLISNVKDFEQLPFYLKEEVLWEAENDDIDKTELLKEEMGMIRQTPGTASRLATIKNKSFRTIRKGLGDDYTLFKESNIPVREFPIDIGEVRLNTEQHDRLSKLYDIKRYLNPENYAFPEDMNQLIP
ncbi:hypothetical protein LCGC14_2665360, partial [marine sediment metagenome]